jgi:hypothetical protein
MRITALAIAAAATAATVVLAWPRPGGQGAPVAFLSNVVRLLAANRYAEAWQSLHPTDQALAPEAMYVACETESPIPGRLVSLNVTRVRHDRIGVAVTFAVRIAGSQLPGGVRIILTAHAVRAGRHWAWILPPKRRDEYRHGCGNHGGPPA